MSRGRYFLSGMLSLLVLAALSAAPALAQHGEAGAGAKGEPPPLFPWAPELFIWTLCVFLILLFVLTKFAWRPMLDALRRREETIRGAVEEAKLARAEMERLRADFEARMAEANAQIPKMMAEARRHAEELAADMRARAQADIQADRQRLRREIDTARDQALQELSSHTARLATLISAKVLGRSLTEDDHRRLFDEALGEIRQAGAQHRGNGAGVH